MDAETVANYLLHESLELFSMKIKAANEYTT